MYVALLIWLTSFVHSILVDKLNTGWLTWGKAYRGYAVPEEKSFEWDPASAEAISVIRSKVTSKAFWESMFKNLSQEHTRDYLA
jgi:proteasome activator subunit 4